LAKIAFRHRKKRGGIWKLVSAGIAAGVAIGLALPYLPSLAQMMEYVPSFQSDEGGSVHYGFCFMGVGFNCVVDGDTFWMGGEKIRIADIDAPETHPPRCAYEADLGQRATVRLRELLSDGSIELQAIDRDHDQYGRKLRIVIRNGESLGLRLVQEGLARRWTGSRQPWC
jgi:micrococcal nuclease